jgi:hypothetical protein
MSKCIILLGLIFVTQGKILINTKVSGLLSSADMADDPPEAGTITFILISDHILDHGLKIDLRSYQDHIAVQ